MATSADEVRWLKRAFHDSYSWRTTALIEKKFERALLQSAWLRVNLCAQAETGFGELELLSETQLHGTTTRCQQGLLIGLRCIAGRVADNLGRVSQIIDPENEA